MSTQDNKLNLILAATTAFPGLSINDALTLHLNTLYGPGKGLDTLLFEYGLNIDSYVDGGSLTQHGVLSRAALLQGG